MRVRWAALAVVGGMLAGGVGALGTAPAFTVPWHTSLQNIYIPCQLDDRGLPLPTVCMLDTGTSYDMMVSPGLASFLDARPVGDPVDVLTFVGPQTLKRVGLQVTVGGQEYTAAAMVAPFWDGGPIIGLALMERMGNMSVDFGHGTVSFTQPPTVATK